MKKIYVVNESKLLIEPNISMSFGYKGLTIGTGNPIWGSPEEPVFIIKLGKRL
jgi:hypothetical protein